MTENPLRLARCTSAQGHNFNHAAPAPGNFGNVVIYCTRCGATRGELAIAAARTAI